MARKKKPPLTPAGKAYLVSFGDTMTTLLAFFIVLCSLAKEQTGANLHSGTGSFVRALDSFGMPGRYSSGRSHRAFHMGQPNPVYLTDEGQGEPEVNALGPDDTDNGGRVIDRELEQFTRFVNEMERLSQVRSAPRVKGETVFDFFVPLPRKPPYLPEPVVKSVAPLVPLLRRDDYRVTVIVWATTPAESAWQRAVEQAAVVQAELADTAGLQGPQRNRIDGQARPWPYSDQKRPSVSFLVQKLDRE